jgi:hypothetical protein
MLLSEDAEISPLFIEDMHKKLIQEIHPNLHLWKIGKSSFQGIAKRLLSV